jgi:chromate transport protein ChrA
MAIRLAVLSIAAVGAAFFAPPVGAVLGVVAIVLAVRAKTVVPSRPRVVAIVSGVIAVLIGVVLSSAALLFRTELIEYDRCRNAANTVQAQQNCQDALNESLASRLGL